MIIQCTPAMADAVSVIFKREGIEYSHGVGPGCIAIEVKKQNEKRVREALVQWLDAVEKLHNQVMQVKRKTT